MTSVVTNESGAFAFTTPLKEMRSPKERLQLILERAGVTLTGETLSPATENRKAYFYNARTGSLMVRATAAEMAKIESTLRAVTSAPPQVSLEMQYVESSRSDIDLNFGKKGTGLGTAILTERQFRVAMQTLKDAEGVDVVTAPAITTISGRQARLRAEQPAPPPYQTPPRLPKDTRPGADPTPRNSGRLPFPPTFVPEGFPSGSPR
jgi:type II secretory pathway component GspD/PulD (secretin)